MNPLISAQQAYFFKTHGYLELEEVLSPSECSELQEHIDAALLSRVKKSLSRVPEESLYLQGRDLWRIQESLKTLLLSKKMTNIALALANKPSLYLAFDQWIPPLSWSEPSKAKDLFSIQGLACIYLIRLSAPKEIEALKPTFGTEPGLIPLPTARGSLLAINPQLLLNLPKLSLYSASLYAVGYALDEAVYFHNAKDPCNHQLKDLGYHFGDRLTHKNHPQIRKY